MRDTTGSSAAAKSLPVALAPSANGQTRFLVKPKNAFVVRFHTFTAQQDMDAPVTKSTTFPSDLGNTFLQPFILGLHLWLIVQYCA